MQPVESYPIWYEERFNEKTCVSLQERTQIELREQLSDARGKLIEASESSLEIAKARL